MATNFSEGGPGVSPKQFKPGPGQIGVGAAMHQPRGRGEGRTQQGRSASPHSRQKIGAPDALPEEPQDTRHLSLAIEHEAAKTLGRDLPVGLWMMRNGAHDGPYFDYLEQA